MPRRAGVSRPRAGAHGPHNASHALSRLEREHVALLLAICDLEEPARRADPVDPMTASTEVQGALLALLREDLGRTQHALSRVALGTYGACEECQRPLSRRLLELVPAATRCAACAARARRLAQN